MYEPAPRAAVRLRPGPPSAPPGTGGTDGTRATFRRGVRWIGRTSAHAALGLPLTLVAVPLALCGHGNTAARVQRARTRRFGTSGDGDATSPADAITRTRPGARRKPRTPAGDGAGRIGAGRVLWHSLLTFPPALVSFIAVVISLIGVYTGYLYFLRPDAISALGHPLTADQQFDNSWGGPTLAGAWSVHALTILGVHVLALALMRGAAAFQDRATRRLLTPDR